MQTQDMVLVNDEDILPAREEVAPPTKKIKTESATAAFHLPNDKYSTVLPDPFPLPVNFPPDIMNALETKTMLPKQSGKFYGVVARAVYALKCYPTSAEYERLG